MLYEKVFNRVFRRWACDHDPVEYDKEVHKTSGNNGYFDVFSYYVYTHTTRFYKNKKPQLWRRGFAIYYQYFRLSSTLRELTVYQIHE